MGQSPVNDTPYAGMSLQRFTDLMGLYDPAALTQQEQAHGWHYCESAWDGLLISPVDAEYKFCTCPHAQSYKRADSYYESLLNFKEFLKENPQYPLDGTPDEWYNTNQ
jgi:hypothetical protein